MNPLSGLSPSPRPTSSSGGENSGILGILSFCTPESQVAIMATARMRKTFAYPDSDDDSEPEGIDEQEQEQLINAFIEADAKKTENYKVSPLAVLSIRQLMQTNIFMF